MSEQESAAAREDLSKQAVAVVRSDDPVFQSSVSGHRRSRKL